MGRFFCRGHENIAFNDTLSFNRDILGWDVFSVIFMEYMFGGAVTFNQNLRSWGNQLTDDTDFTLIFEATNCASMWNVSFTNNTLGPFCSLCQTSKKTHWKLSLIGSTIKLFSICFVFLIVAEAFFKFSFQL